MWPPISPRQNPPRWRSFCISTGFLAEGRFPGGGLPLALLSAPKVAPPLLVRGVGRALPLFARLREVFPRPRCWPRPPGSSFGSPPEKGAGLPLASTSCPGPASGRGGSFNPPRGNRGPPGAQNSPPRGPRRAPPPGGSKPGVIFPRLASRLRQSGGVFPKTPGVAAAFPLSPPSGHLRPRKTPIGADPPPIPGAPPPP